MPAPTTATFHLPHSSAEPLELSIKMPALAMAVVHRDAIARLDERWAKAIGVYVLLGPSQDAAHDYRAYVGQSGTGGLRQRLATHRNSPSWQQRHNLPKDWWQRALICRSRDEDGFNSAEAGWLEGRLWDILNSAPAALLVGKKDEDQTLPKHERDRLEQYLPTMTAVLRAIGASPDTPEQTPPRQAKKKRNAEVIDLIRAGLLPPDARLRSIPAQHEVIAEVRPDGQLEVAGSLYNSPSGAAVAVAKRETNGWTFWGVPSGDGRLVPLAELRGQLEPAGGETTEMETPEPKKAKLKEKKPRETSAGALKALLEAGLLAPGTTLVATFHGEEHQATVDAEGRIRLANGTAYANPSGASRAIAGYETNGWNFWKLQAGDKRVRLADLRAKLKTSA